MPREHVAVKRLALVEVAPNASHQHELNATILRRALEIEDARVSGALTIAFYTEDGQPPVFEETTYTLYDSRENQPKRSSEHRLYYASPLVARMARPGDLLVVYRGEGESLRAVIARTGTVAERDLVRALLADEKPALKRFLQATPPPADYEAGAELASALIPLSATPVVTRDLAALINESKTFRTALDAGSLPSAREMARAAQAIAARMHQDATTADDFLVDALDAESALFGEIEQQLGDRALKGLVDRSELSFRRVLEFAMKYHQARKSRRGQSLQNHFAALLDREAISYSAQSVTEGKERPDFIMPGEREYHEPGFPTRNLRMVACKSRTRERWGQVLKEADRVEEKYLLSVDEDITDDAIRSMSQNRIRIFIPKATLDKHYGKSAERRRLGTVAELIQLLRTAAKVS
jgi:hypothetical protein